MKPRLLSRSALRSALAIRDLSDPLQGSHGLQLLVEAIEAALAARTDVSVHRGPRIVSVADNYDALRIGPDAVTRDARYTRWVDEGRVLRTHTSALVPGILQRLPARADQVVLVPGIVYRRDRIDRIHSGEPHQMDVWRLRSEGPSLGPIDLEDLAKLVADTVLPGREARLVPTEHPYTLGGREIQVWAEGMWLEIGECGLAHPEVLAAAGRSGTGLAMGLGLDRLLMLRKGIPDIRLLRAEDPRIARQMQDLEPWRAVSSMPPIRRDLSLALQREKTPEEIGDAVRVALGPRAEMLEEIEIVSETPGDLLPAAARARIGMSAEQKNVLLRLVLRALDRTLTHAEANELRNDVYRVLHEGSIAMWAASRA